MARRSAGLLVYRRRENAGLEVLLVHPGGPYFADKDLGIWSVPKGEYQEGESPASAADREFAEELGMAPPAGERLDLGEVRQASGKVVRAFAVEGDLDVSLAESNRCEIEWPPRSGRRLSIPEVDRAEWFSSHEAARRVNPAQVAFLERLARTLEPLDAR